MISADKVRGMARDLTPKGVEPLDLPSSFKLVYEVNGNEVSAYVDIDIVQVTTEEPTPKKRVTRANKTSVKWPTVKAE